MSISNDCLKRTTEFEGNFDFMHQDSEGFVTVGVGSLLATSHDAIVLPFLKRGTADAATADEKSGEWATIKSKAKGRKETWYEQFTTLVLKQDTIDRLLKDELTKAEGELRSAFPDYDKYPQGVQEALIDMAFNLGITGVTQKFPNFTKAVKAQDWSKAAQECNRPQVQDERNKTIKGLFLAAANAAKNTSATGSGRKP